MSIFSRLFGGKAQSAPQRAAAETYKNFTIQPDPIKESDGWRIAAVIEKGGRTHRLIRADTIRDEEGACQASIAKARQAIDEQGERLFD